MICAVGKSLSAKWTLHFTSKNTKIPSTSTCILHFFMPRIHHHHHHQNGVGNDGSTAKPSLPHTSTLSSHYKKGVIKSSYPKKSPDPSKTTAYQQKKNDLSAPIHISCNILWYCLNVIPKIYLLDQDA